MKIEDPVYFETLSASGSISGCGKSIHHHSGLEPGLKKPAPVILLFFNFYRNFYISFL